MQKKYTLIRDIIMRYSLKIFAFLLCICFLFSACGTKTEVSTGEMFIEGSGSESNLSDNSSTNASKNNTPLTQITKDETDNSSSSKNKNASSNKGNVTDNSISSEKPNVGTPPDSSNSTNTSNPSAKNYIEQSSGSNSLRVYTLPSSIKDIENYSVFVRVSDKEDWVPVPVGFAEVARSGLGTHRTYFASVDVTGKIQVKVSPNKDFSNCSVEPLSDNIIYKYEDKNICFTVDKACQLVLRFDGEVFGCLQLFVNPMETDFPGADGKNVIYVSSGIHTKDNSDYIVSGRDGKGAKGGFPCVILESNQTLYLAGGAVLNAMVVVKEGAENVKICGRGIINLLFANVESGTNEDTIASTGGEYPNGIRAAKNKNLKIEGIIIRNSCHYAVMGNGLNGLYIDNIKIFNRCQWSDGIDCIATRNAEIKNCYLRTNDDGIAIYGSYWGYYGDVYNWNVKNCVFLTDCAHSIYIGPFASDSENNRDEVYNLKFSDIDILDDYENLDYYQGAIGITACGSNYVHDIIFDSIRMYGLAKSRPFNLQIVRESKYQNPGYRIENITFNKVTLYGSDYLKDFCKRSRIKGYNSERYITGISFKNLVICGEKITSENKGHYFEIGNYANNITYN